MIERYLDGIVVKSMGRSYIVLTILLFLLIVAAASSLRRCAVGERLAEPASSPSPSPSETSPAAPTGPALAGLRSRAGQASIKEISKPSPAIGIDGLVPRLSRPVALQAQGVRGLAVGDNALYVSIFSPERSSALIYQLRRDTLTVAQVRDIAQDEYYVVGGLHLSHDTLWVPVIADDEHGSSLILALDTRSLEQRHRLSVDGRITLVLQGSAGSLYGFNDEGSLIYEWAPDGQEIRRQPSTTGTLYSDGQVVGENLICAGADLNGGVIDIIDSASLSILARHRCYALASDGTFLSQYGFDLELDQSASEVVFYFLVPGPRFPMLLSYVLDDIPFQEWAPRAR
ncbi:MAG: hypothetical protein H5T69_07285 [Chloroflexi bacterium]|nr:hypothetical protein [Chloroflexota bacterium]